MSLQTRPVFYTVGDVNELNNQINFVEPNIAPTELTANISVGSYSMTELMNEIVLALNSAGDQTYTATFNRDTRIVTISSSDTFELLFSSGTSTIQINDLIGFGSTDRTGASTYDGVTAMGDEYVPQFPVQNFIDFDDDVQNVQSNVNESASGIQEVVTFGQRKTMTMNITNITDRFKAKGNFIENNSNAVQDARDFLSFAITKSNLEFMKDRSDRATFHKVLLESTTASRDGTGFRLRELVGQGLEGFYETGNLRFRLIE